MLARGSERETAFSRVNERTLNPRVSGLRGLPQSGEHPEGRGQGGFLDPVTLDPGRMGKIRIFGDVEEGPLGGEAKA